MVVRLFRELRSRFDEINAMLESIQANLDRCPIDDDVTALPDDYRALTARVLDIQRRTKWRRFRTLRDGRILVNARVLFPNFNRFLDDAEFKNQTDPMFEENEEAARQTCPYCNMLVESAAWRAA